MTAFTKAQATAFDTSMMDPNAKILITTEGIARDREIVEVGVG